MKNEIKNNDNCARRAYVPASVKVIKFTTMQRILDVSDGLTGTDKTIDDIQ